MEVGAAVGAREQRPLRRARRHARPRGRPVGCQTHGCLLSRTSRQRVDAEVETMGREVVGERPASARPGEPAGCNCTRVPPPQRRVWTPTWQPLTKPPTRMSWPVALSVGSGAGGRRCSGPPWIRRRRYWTKYDTPQPRAIPLLGACPRTTGQVPSRGCFGRQGLASILSNPARRPRREREYWRHDRQGPC